MDVEVSEDYKLGISCNKFFKNLLKFFIKLVV